MSAGFREKPTMTRVCPAYALRATAGKFHRRYQENKQVPARGQVNLDFAREDNLGEKKKPPPGAGAEHLFQAGLERVRRQGAPRMRFLRMRSG